MDALRYAFVHNSWATRRMIEICQELTAEQRDATTTGAFGSFLETLKHLVDAEGLRLRTLLAGSRPDWDWRRDEVPDLGTIAARAEDNERFWEGFFASPADADREVEVDWQGGLYHVPAGAIMAQVVHHGNAHREQLCAILTGLGIEPPDISGWGFAGAHGLIVEVD